MEIKELKEKSDTELGKLLKSSRERLRELRFKTTSKQLKNVRAIRSARRTVAQILTLMRQRRIINKDNKQT